MSAIAALKGYRTQFLYSLYYILSHSTEEYIFKFEGEEDLDVIDRQGNLLFAIQVKNLAKTVTLSDIFTERKTSFLRRFLDKYSTATPILVSFGNISIDLKNWKNTLNSVSLNEMKVIKKYQITDSQWKLIKGKTKFIEVEENALIDETLKLLKTQYHLIGPEPTADILLYWLQHMAEKQISVTTIELFSKVEDFTLYQTQCISVAEQYTLSLKPLRNVSTSGLNSHMLEEEFYNGTNARYEHVMLDLDILRENYLNKIAGYYSDTNVVIVKGSSGQGKSTLAYRYAYLYSPQNLVYELNIQEDPVNSRKAIQAIISITKHLATPILFIIHVKSNSTEWLKIVKEFAHHTFVRFLITIRHEDWFKATAIGIDFLHKEIEISLVKNEAELIYNMLSKRKEILHCPNFEEAWVRVGNDSPLMEFIYFVTQGDSLKARLKQQVLQLDKEDNQNNNQKQTEFLRLICLANSFGAKLDISKLAYAANIQFLIERLEKEYIIKVSENGKHIAGVHLLRSEILSDILFDEFVSNKKDYALKCLSIVSDEDCYLFLLYCFLNNILTPEEVIETTKEMPVFNWAYYHNVQGSLIWAGIRNYIYINTTVLNECYDAYGDSWMLMIDIFHGNTFSTQNLLDSLPFNNDYKKSSISFNARMTSKQLVYGYIETFFNTVNLPPTKPVTAIDWEGFGSTLFWLKNTSNVAKSVIEIPSENLETAFETLGLKRLSKLMLGMYYYSPYYNNLRQNFSHHFISRLQEEFRVAHVVITDEISVDYIIDILSRDENRSNNDLSMEILDLLRDAFPDKKKYDAIGHGHRLQLIALPHDDTQKGITIENFPLDNWVNINGTTNKLYSFTHRPKDWQKYHNLIDAYEKSIDSILKEFNTILSSYLKNPTDYKQLIALVNNANHPYSVTIKEPQSISDSLGIYFDTRKEKTDKNQTGVQYKLKTKYGNLFKSQRDFQTGIENFIRQSGKALFARLDKIVNPSHNNDSDSERLSKVNLFDAIENYNVYKAERTSVFENLKTLNTGKINSDTLYATAIFWNAYLNTDKTSINRNLPSITQIKSDVETRIDKACKTISKPKELRIKYINNASTENKPIIIIDTDNTALSMLGFKEAYNIIKEAVGCPDYTSLKYLALRIWFPKFHFIQLTKGNTINNQWNEMPVYLFRDTSFEELGIHNILTKPIDLKIAEKLSLRNWNKIFPKLDEIQKLSEAFIKMRLLVEHLYDLRFFETVELNAPGKILFSRAVQSTGEDVQKSFQYVLDYLADVLILFHFDADSYEVDELEREYWNHFLAIKESIFPTDKGDEEDYTLKLDISSIEQWIERLKPCTKSWGIFTLLLYGKYIDLYEKNKAIIPA